MFTPLIGIIDTILKIKLSLQNDSVVRLRRKDADWRSIETLRIVLLTDGQFLCFHVSESLSACHQFVTTGRFNTAYNLSQPRNIIQIFFTGLWGQSCVLEYSHAVPGMESWQVFWARDRHSNPEQSEHARPRHVHLEAQSDALSGPEF